MYRALYDYKTTLARYLTFQTGDEFTLLDKSHKDWFLAQNGFGEIGFIPSNFIEKVEVTESEVLKSIDRAIEAIHFQAVNSSGVYTHAQRENLQKLVQHRKSVVESFRQGQVSSLPVSPSHTVAGASSNKTVAEPIARQNSTESQTRSHSVKRTAPLPPSSPGTLSGSTTPKKTQEVTPFSQTLKPKEPVPADTVDTATSPIRRVPEKTPSDINLDTIELPDNIGSELVEEVRRNTNLSYDKSVTAVETVLGHLGYRIPEISTLLDRLFGTFEPKNDVETEESSQDFARLLYLFSEIAACKDDSQQRSWTLHEDEAEITGYLEELLSIFENAKQSVCKRALEQENYESVHNLVQYYQMETRVKLRLLLLQCFGALCGLDSLVISLLLFSILTTELARELQDNIDDIQRVNYITLVLTMMFSTGESVPANLHDHLNKDFITFVFDTIETPPSPQHEDQLTDLLVNFILAFNLHFQSIEDNIIMKVLAEKGTVKVFTEKILLLINREDDPVRMFDYEPKPPNSVIKFFHDLYSSKSTGCLLYTNDAKVLIDIILRYLVDLSPGDKLRTSYLHLMQLLLQNSDYSEHKHQLTKLDQCLCRIHEEEANTELDKAIVNQILEQQYSLFNS